MLRIEQICLGAGDFRLRDVTFEVAAEEYFVVMGPTGSGKTLLLKAVCGLIRVASGRVAIGGADVTNLEPRFRRVGYVPQDSGLFPHLSVARNITFGLRVTGIRHAEAMARVAALVEILGLGSLLERSTLNLSGGERQKVALARALAIQPALLLLDEPVSALDEPTRREICHLLRRVKSQFGVSTLHVCHNRREARDLADRVGVMSGGRLVQVGTLEELVDRPADPLVRRLLMLEGEGQEEV
ncbi:MAG TPA: ATP-binding cassette domain-containing protein [Phycisphaerae bacterium]|nr:ATP-binding cassette domain-containing protein [Phycisphaerae bacterium]